jgi:hypothetical protein
MGDFPHISSVAVNKLLLFPCTYLSETAFSRYASKKAKYGNWLNAEHDMSIQLAEIVPDFNSLSAISRSTRLIM